MIASPNDATCATASQKRFRTTLSDSNLPSGQECASIIPSTPETRPINTPFNDTMPTVAQLMEFYEHPDWSGPPKADFYRVTGHYTGSTDMILRWAACKWGIGENVVRAQAWTESKWIQGGPKPGDGGGDKRFTRKDCIQGAFTALWNYECDNCCWTSWGILQTKVYYEWGTWPMIKDSTAFNADYRYADQRACMKGDYSTYFQGRNGNNGHTYASDIASGNLNTILWGCIGMHFSGDWYDDGAIRYIKETKGYLTTKPWLKLMPQQLK